MNFDLSISIVCMKNQDDLKRCIDSIYTHTKKYRIEIIVIAYLCDKEFYNEINKRYPLVRIIRSNEIRGYAENHNLALRIAKGKYLMVLNDDTYLVAPTIDSLLDVLEANTDIDFISPKVLNGDSTIQSCGKPYFSYLDYLLKIFSIRSFSEKRDESCFQQGLFQSYNITGCCFIAKAHVMRKLGYFNETYFFCPEDIALSTKANKFGYKCYVDERISIYHLHASTSSKICTATIPTMLKGECLFFSNNSFIKMKFLQFMTFISAIMKFLIFKVQNNEMKSQAYMNVMKSIFTSYTPKETFIKYYSFINGK